MLRKVILCRKPFRIANGLPHFLLPYTNNINVLQWPFSFWLVRKPMIISVWVRVHELAYARTTIEIGRALNNYLVIWAIYLIVHFIWQQFTFGNKFLLKISQSLALRRVDTALQTTLWQWLWSMGITTVVRRVARMATASTLLATFAKQRIPSNVHRKIKRFLSTNTDSCGGCFVAIATSIKIRDSGFTISRRTRR